jgi:hypothetical protein
MGKTKDLSGFERGMAVDARCTGLSVSRTATLLAGFFIFNSSRVYQEWSTTQRTSSPVGSIGVNIGVLWEALESTWASIPVECFRLLVESMPRQIEAALRAKVGTTQY